MNEGCPCASDIEMAKIMNWLIENNLAMHIPMRGPIYFLSDPEAKERHKRNAIQPASTGDQE
jgi:hypothetical protein